MPVRILIEFSEDQAAALRDQKAKSGCPVSEFVRRAVAAALRRPTLESYYRPGELSTNERYKAEDAYLVRRKAEQK